LQNVYGAGKPRAQQPESTGNEFQPHWYVLLVTGQLCDVVIIAEARNRIAVTNPARSSV
jgi:hypothetical protein